jgi:Ni,Fe-hydrogenase maturation factor
MHGPVEGVLLIGCEPADLGGDEGRMGLSEVVEAAVEAAVQTTESLVQRILIGAPIGSGQITAKEN